MAAGFVDLRCAYSWPFSIVLLGVLNTAKTLAIGFRLMLSHI